MYRIEYLYEKFDMECTLKTEGRGYTRLLLDIYFLLIDDYDLKCTSIKMQRCRFIS